MATHGNEIVMKIDGLSRVKEAFDQLQMDVPDQYVPTEILDWLTKLGWQPTNANWPSNEKLFYKHGAHDGLYMTWSEAVSCEFFRFLTLGTTGQKRSSGADVTQSAADAGHAGER